MDEMKEPPRITIEVDDEIKEKFTRKCGEKGHTMKWVLMQFIRKYICE